MVEYMEPQYTQKEKKRVFCPGLLFGLLLFIMMIPCRAAAEDTYASDYGEQLSGEALQIYREMVTAWGNYQTNPDLILTHSFSSADDYSFEAEIEDGKPVLADNESYKDALEKVRLVLQQAYDAFSFDHPEAFWLASPTKRVSFASSAKKVSGSDSLYRLSIAKLEITGTQWYDGAASQSRAFQKKVLMAADAIKAGLPADADRAQIVWAIHDYITGKVSYGGANDDSRISYTAAGVFLQKYRVICQGYAKACKILCDQFGIPCVLIVGKSMDSSSVLHDHMWNYVRLEDGKWYLLDLTWDDQPGVLVDTYFLAGKNTTGFYRKVSEDHVPGKDLNGGGTSFILPVLSTTGYVKGQHLWTETARVPSTCKKKGSVTYICEYCKETRAEQLPLADHTWAAKWTVDKRATVFEEGQKSIRCTVCSAVKTTKTIARLTPKATLSTAYLELTAGKKQRVKVQKLAYGDSVVSWTSGAPSYVSVSAKGLVKALKSTGKKKVKITVTFASGLKKSLKVKVLPNPKWTAALEQVPKKLRLTVGETSKLQPLRLPETSTQKIRYQSSDTEVATVSKKGTVKAKKKGTAVITVISGSIRVKCKVTVRK